ncbi:MAG: RebB family R body protein [Rhodobacteraceae bacterium]|nr:RebB family R body protein [Paracoccaceae bacterium]
MPNTTTGTTDAPTKPADADPNVTEINTLVFGLAPAVALGSIYSSMAQSLGILYQNSVAAQKLQSVTADAIVTDGAMLLNAQSAAMASTVKNDADPLQALAKLIKQIKAMEP